MNSSDVKLQTAMDRVRRYLANPDVPVDANHPYAVKLVTKAGENWYFCFTDYRDDSYLLRDAYIAEHMSDGC